MDPLRLTLARASSNVAGVCVVEDSQTYNKERGFRTGWVNIVGVRKPLQHRGLGTALLVDGMNWLRGRGLDTIFIGVDTGNEKALDLYKSLRFSAEHESLLYRLNI